jgi:ribosomal peptide maturation radical SAM protein 1
MNTNGAVDVGERREHRDDTSVLPHEYSVALVYMPWGGISRGSIALGILKECARRIGVGADVHYLNIRFAEMIGFEFYEHVCDGEVLLPEWFFSYPLFGPNGLGLMDNSWSHLMTSRYSPMVKASMAKAGWTELKCRELTEVIIPAYLDACMTTIDWSSYKLVGFSSTFAQTTSSLLLSKRIKDRHPDVKIVFGGANTESDIGLELIKAFDWVDYVVHGEAEDSFPKLVTNVLSGSPFEEISGVSMRKGSAVFAANTHLAGLQDLNESPTPDYSDYMREVDRAGITKVFPIVLPFESSRGCWWGAKAHCTFCGLNDATMGFRKKDPERVYEDVMTIANKYRCLKLDAVDNIMDLSYMDTLLPKLAQADLDFSLFYEVKASLSKEQVRRLAAAGINRIQPGIESLSTDLLHLMRKGMTATQNIQLLKWCVEYGITPLWNILYGFPGERAEYYADYPRIMRLIMHMQPSGTVCPVVFERFSPYHFQREKFNLTLRPLGYYKFLYPEQLVDTSKLAYYFEGEWEGGGSRDMEDYIRPVRDTWREWTEAWETKRVFFNYEKGPGFITLFDNRPLQPGAETSTRRIRLNEIQSTIYSYCDQAQSFPTIHQMVTSAYGAALSMEQTRTVVDRFVEHGLMFREADRYLSLAVRRKSRHPSTAGEDDRAS